MSRILRVALSCWWESMTSRENCRHKSFEGSSPPSCLSPSYHPLCHSPFASSVHDFCPFFLLLLLLFSRLLRFRFFSADAVMSRKVSRNWFCSGLSSPHPHPQPPQRPLWFALDIIYCKIISVLLLLCGCPESCSKTKFLPSFLFIFFATNI